MTTPRPMTMPQSAAAPHAEGDNCRRWGCTPVVGSLFCTCGPNYRRGPFGSCAVCKRKPLALMRVSR